ncbi:DUF4229 domain-containing protein [Streptomyces sp. LX-29]|uniref:DUF4229 domain-containing protein n=1 Tax=unclassified Streptomyces TaxID=2593676 RepID=UPI0021B39CB8|nr:MULTISPECIES: DUF4229 domain-containing protein [unclassified Streptomyces]WFB08048.1 DUF4229 domain-containing protein [Streptomyces sp. LX-29]
MSLKTSATFRYSVMRLGIFAGCFLVMWALVSFRVFPAAANGSSFIWVLLLALVVSAPLSLVLLRKQRDEMSEQIVVKVDRAKQKLAANRGQEDDL